MSEAVKITTEDEVFYPESDGQPISDNTEQFRWIKAIEDGLEDYFRDDPNVFVAGDLLWYPVEGSNTIRLAPDAMVAFGRPKGRRGSYRQWDEGGVAPQVVFEVMSPGNNRPEMRRKRTWYERYGVDEFYIYDPDRGTFEGYLRQEPGDRLEPLKVALGWVSPRLGLRFELVGKSLELYQPDGERILEPGEVRQREREAQQRLQSMGQQAQAERQRADTERQRAERLAEFLRQQGFNPDQI